MTSTPTAAPTTERKSKLNPSGNLLDVIDLKTYFRTMDGVVKAVDGVDISIKPGHTLGVVGESGCGKSVTSLSIMRLVDQAGWIAGGQITSRARTWPNSPRKQMRHIRGDEISMIFQEPMTSPQPRLYGGQSGHGGDHRAPQDEQAGTRSRSGRLFRMVGIPSPDRRVKDYPHNMSGGMRQRVMIAMALALQPDLLIADEPTTALDVTIQAQILELIKDLREDNTAVLLITHDIGVVAEMADDVVVMYTGKVVEEGTVMRSQDAQAPVHGGPAQLHPVDRPEGPAPQRDPRHRPQPAQSAQGLPVCPALPARHGRLPRGASSAEDTGRWQLRTVLVVLRSTQPSAFSYQPLDWLIAES